ncbi:MAG TPA: ATP-dependent Clp protease proteolytic subunit [Kofleriaceae bacterium]|nr:ATP-dependent Clp protease proteolytic subunit [Kofleriaceae bacterium]
MVAFLLESDRDGAGLASSEAAAVPAPATVIIDCHARTCGRFEVMEVLAGAIVAMAVVVALVRLVGSRAAPVRTEPGEPQPPIDPDTTKDEQGWALFSRLLRERIVFLGTTIDDAVAEVVVAQLLFLESEDRDAPIRLYINSPGGHVAASFAIYDAMTHVAPPVSTIVLGQASGAALMIAAHGARGRRSAMPLARFRITQLSSARPDTDLAALRRSQDNVNRLLAADTGQSVSTIERDSEAERGFTAAEAVDYGLIDEIVVRRPSA